MRDFVSEATVITLNESIVVWVSLIHRNSSYNGSHFTINVNFTIHNRGMSSETEYPWLWKYDAASIHTDCTFKNDLPFDLVKANIILPFDLIQAGAFSQAQTDRFFCEHDCDPEAPLPTTPYYTYTSVENSDHGDIKSFLQFRAVGYSKPDKLEDGKLDISPIVASEGSGMVKWHNSAAFGYFSGHEKFTHHNLNILLKTEDAYERCAYANFRFVLGLGEPMDPTAHSIWFIFGILFCLPLIFMLTVVPLLYICTCEICSRSFQWIRRRIFLHRSGYSEQFWPYHNFIHKSTWRAFHFSWEYMKRQKTLVTSHRASSWDGEQISCSF